MCNSIVSHPQAKDNGLWNITPEGYYRLLGFAKWVVFSHPHWNVDPEDMLQEVLLIGLEEFQGWGDMKSFLKACMINYGGNYWRHNRRVLNFTTLTHNAKDDEEATDLIEHVAPKVYNPEPKEDLDEDLANAIEKAIDMCHDKNPRRRAWTQNRKAALKEVLHIFVQSIKDSQGIGVTEYDNATPYKYKYPKAHQRERMRVRPVRTEILDNMSKRLDIKRQKACQHLTMMREATDIAVKHIYEGEIK